MTLISRRIKSRRPVLVTPAGRVSNAQNGTSSSMSPCRGCALAAGAGGTTGTAISVTGGAGTPGAKNSQPISLKTGHVVVPPDLLSKDQVLSVIAGLLPWRSAPSRVDAAELRHGPARPLAGAGEAHHVVGIGDRS